MKTLVAALLGIGFTCIMLSHFWPQRDAKAVWSQKQAEERRDAALELHELMGRKAQAANKHEPVRDKGKAAPLPHSHGDEPSDEEFRAAQERFKNSNRDIERARSAASLPARILFWGGILAATIGLACYGYERVSQS